MLRILSTSTTLALCAVLAGCVEVHQLPEHDAGPPPPQNQDGGACMPPPASCTVVEVVAGDTPFDVIAPDGSIEATHHGSWTHLSHPADVAATLYVESLAAPAGADDEWAGAHLALRTAATSAEIEHRQSFSLTHPGSFSFPLYAPEQDLFLFPAGWSFEVRVCYEVRDPFPTCVANGGGLPECPGLPSVGFRQTEGDACACLPSCVTAADCPIPSSGDVSPACNARQQCVLPCDASSQCPDGQVCSALPAELDPSGSSICVTQH